MGQILWGSALGDCTREEKQRGGVRGESKGGTHYGENLYGGDTFGECMGVRGHEGFVNGFVYYSGRLPNPGISYPRTCPGASRAQIGTKSDAEMIGLANLEN